MLRQGSGSKQRELNGAGTETGGGSGSSCHVSTQYLMNAGPRKLGGRHVHAVLSVTYVRPVDRLAIANLTELRFAWDGWGKTCQPGTHRGRF